MRQAADANQAEKSSEIEGEINKNNGKALLENLENNAGKNAQQASTLKNTLENTLATTLATNDSSNRNDDGKKLATLIQEASIDVFDLQEASKNLSPDHSKGYSKHIAQVAGDADGQASSINEELETSTKIGGLLGEEVASSSNLLAEDASKALRQVAEKADANTNAKTIASSLAEKVDSSLATQEGSQEGRIGSGVIRQQEGSDVLKASQPAINRASPSSAITQSDTLALAKEPAGSTNKAPPSLNQSLAQSLNQNLAGKSALNNANANLNGNFANSPTTAEALRTASAASTNSNLPELDIQTKVEVRAHNPEAVRLSGNNAFEASALARSNNNLAPSHNNLARAGNSAQAASSASNSLSTLNSLNSNPVASKQEPPREEARERLASKTINNDKNTQQNNRAKSVLNYLASRLTAGGARNEAVNGNRPGGAGGEATQDAASRASQAFSEARSGQSFSQSSQQGSQYDSSSGNAFSQNSATQVSNSATAQRGASTFATASSFVREQVFVNIQRAVEGKVDSMTVKMRPEMLGRIEIRLDGDSAGRLQIVVLAERSETLDLLQRDARQLEQALQQAGIRTQEQGLQFGLQGQGKQDAEPDNANGANQKAAQAGDKADDELDEALDDDQILPANIDRLQLRQDGRLDVQI